MRFLEAVLDLGAVAEIGMCERTHDGQTDYIMVRDDGPRRYGAVAYVKPRNGGLTLRLSSQDAEDEDQSLVKLRQVCTGHPYAVTCALERRGG